MYSLKADIRGEVGKKAKFLRKKGFLPAALYGPGVESRPVSVRLSDFEEAHQKAGESSLITLEYEKTQVPVLIHGIAYDPLKGHPIHADFYAVRMDRKIKTHVPLAFYGESPAVKSEGGILVKVMRDIEIEAFPHDLPHEIPVDLSALGAIDARVFARDLAFPKGVELVSYSGAVIALVEAPRAEEEIAAAEAAAKEVQEVQTEQEVRRAEKEKAKPEEDAAQTAKQGDSKKEETKGR